MTSKEMDLVMEYMSVLGQGSWRVFNRAVETVVSADQSSQHPRWLARIAAENLSALANAEFAYDTNMDWYICSTAIAGTPSVREGRGILVGCQTSQITDAVRSSAQRHKARFSRISRDLSPSVWELLAGDDSELEAIASEAGVLFVPDSARTLAVCLPSVQSMCDAAPVSALLPGFQTYRFDAETLGWVEVEGRHGDGAYRFDYYGRNEYRVVSRGTVKKVNRSVAIWYALATSGVRPIGYDEGSRTLSVRQQAGLPALYARALALCAGAVPEYQIETRQLHYRAVLPGIARRVEQGLLGARGGTHE